MNNKKSIIWSLILCMLLILPAMLLTTATTAAAQGRDPSNPCVDEDYPNIASYSEIDLYWALSDIESRIAQAEEDLNKLKRTNKKVGGAVKLAFTFGMANVGAEDEIDWYKRHIYSLEVNYFRGLGIGDADEGC
ncbi:hypothetical protein OAO01_01540 [Oligoflexia bacterium]|nr:hypothetical protein [Oligoflexia bacterium]